MVNIEGIRDTRVEVTSQEHGTMAGGLLDIVGQGVQGATVEVDIGFTRREIYGSKVEGLPTSQETVEANPQDMGA
jgi:hypothetical protein